MQRLLLCLCLGGASGLPVFAATQTLDDWYRVEVAVEGRGPAARSQALRKALGDLLVKLSGQQQFLQDAAVKQQLSQAAKWVQGYVYESRPAAHGDLPRSVLVVNFHAHDVKAFMQQVGIPLWGENRPLVLAWIDVAPSGLVSEEYHPRAAQFLSHAAARRGLPLLLPLLDLQDRQQVSSDTMLDLERPAALQSGERYKPDAVLFAQVREQEGRWSSVWKAHTQTDSFAWEGREASLQASLSAGIEQLTDRLSAQVQRSERVTQASQTLSVRIENVQSYRDYLALVTYLEGLGLTQTVKPMEIHAAEVLLELQVRGSEQDFQQATQLNRLLRKAVTQEAAKNSWGEPTVVEGGEANADKSILHYTYQR